MKRLIITGASGFLGQHFLHKLITKNEHYEIHAMYRTMEGFEDSVNDTIKESNVKIFFATCDLTDPASISGYIQAHGTFDICIHLAALSSPGTCEQDPDQARALNVPTHLFNALGETPIVALSTDQVYDGKTPVYSETDQVKPLNVYGATKVEMEEHLLANSNYAICLRSSIILGPLAPFGKAHSTFLHFCRSRETQETTFYTDEIRNVIAVENVVGILEWFCKNGVTKQTRGVYNMGGKTRASRVDMALTVAMKCGYSPDVIISSKKADQPAGVVLSPLDISMDSTALEDLVGFEFHGLQEIVSATFPS
jgi:dTDP-4-dehydrorhamnose reductase